MEQDERKQMKVRLPQDVSDFVANEARKTGASQNSEVIRALREKMDRVQKSAPGQAC